MVSQALIYALWLTPTVLLGVLGCFLWRRKLAKEFPVFFAYTVMHVVRACSLFLVYRIYGYSSSSYFFAYWIAEAVDAGFQLAMMYEIYRHLFRRYESISHLGASLYRWSLVALLLIAIASATAGSGSGGGALRAGVEALHQGTIVVASGLLLLLFVFAASFGLNWSHYVFGLAAGFCICDSVELVVTVVRSQWGPIAAETSSLVHTVAFNCSVLVWTWFFVRREVVPEIATPMPRGELEKWNEALAELLNR
jgi:hypothetical protein